MRLGITVCTRHRPQIVQACVLSLCREVVDKNLDVFIVVVENDRIKRLTGIFDDLRAQFPNVEFIYENEPTVGIPFARNRTVDIALENNADWIAFIDDDEVVEQGWLRAMSDAIHDLDADALTGPVRTVYPSNAPSWWKKPRPDQRCHGQVLESAATNNTLINCCWLLKKNPSLRFNEKLRYTGGSDTEFFYRLTDMGGTIKWVSNAVVQETVSQARTTMYWQITRKARMQANNARNFQDRKGTLAAVGKYLPSVVRRSVLTLPLLAVGLACRPFSRFYSDRLVFSGLKSGAAAVGAMRGLIGWEFEPYRRIEGY